MLALLMGAAAPTFVAAAAQVETAGDAATREELPEAAQADLKRGRELYKKGDYQGALAAFRLAEAAGARSGLFFFEMAFCHQSLGDAAAHEEYLRRAIPYLGRQVDDGASSVEPYYYLAAVYYSQEPQDRDNARRVIDKAVAAHAGGQLAKEMSGESLFRLGRLYSFAVELEAPAGPAGEKSVEERRLDAYREAARKLRRERDANPVYLFLALDEVAQAAERDGRWDEAIASYSTASAVDPRRAPPADELYRLGRQLLGEGKLDLAIQAWQGIRGPNAQKTRANYGLFLLRQAVSHGDLPTSWQGRPVKTLDRASLERGILDVAGFLKAASAAEVAAGEEPPASASISADPQELERQRGLFLALMLAYLDNGHDIRTFAVQNQLIPLVFGHR